MIEKVIDKTCPLCGKGLSKFEAHVQFHCIEYLKDEIARLREEIRVWREDYALLQEENKRLREAARWIPVGERLPEEKEIVDWFYKGWKRSKEGYVTAANTLHVWGGFYSLGTSGLYWRPKPEPPEVK